MGWLFGYGATAEDNSQEDKENKTQEHWILFLKMYAIVSPFYTSFYLIKHNFAAYVFLTIIPWKGATLKAFELIL